MKVSEQETISDREGEPNRDPSDQIIGDCTDSTMCVKTVSEGFKRAKILPYLLTFRSIYVLQICQTRIDVFSQVQKLRLRHTIDQEGAGLFQCDGTRSF